MRLLEQVRASAAATATAARFVHVQTDAIQCYAASLPLDAVRSAELDAATHYLGDGQRPRWRTWCSWTRSILAAGYFPQLAKRPGMSGYFTVASSLKDGFEAAWSAVRAAAQALTTETARVSSARLATPRPTRERSWPS